MRGGRRDIGRGAIRCLLLINDLDLKLVVFFVHIGLELGSPFVD